jgi:serine/threonine protein kinase
MAPTSEGREARVVDPRKLADVTLATALRTACDAVFIEPESATSDRYIVTFERAHETVTSFSLDASAGSATVARLAYLADVDLAASTATSALVPVRSGTREADVVITIRPGDGLRADLLVVPSHAGKRARVTPGVSSTKVGEVIGNYRIVEPLGEGGMGMVFRVEHVVLGRSYALKVLRAKVFEREALASQRFLREARAAARVRHPNIVDVFDFGHLPDGRPYLVMEMLDGESLLERVSRGPLVPPDAVTIARQIAHALAAVHDVGVIHADVTPSNAIVLAGDPLQIKLVDFGLAAIAGESPLDEGSKFVLGTPAYISPEQLMGLSPTDRSDQYGLGCVLFKLLAGRAPFEHEDLRTQCLMHIHDPIPVLDSPYGPLPPKLVDVISTCLQKSPQARFPGMRAMISALDEIERVTDRRGWRKWLSS